MSDESGRQRRVYRAIYDLPGPKEEPTLADWGRLFGRLPAPGLAATISARVDASDCGMSGRGRPQAIPATQPTP